MREIKYLMINAKTFLAKGNNSTFPPCFVPRIKVWGTSALC